MRSIILYASAILSLVTRVRIRCWQHAADRMHPFPRNKVITTYNNITHIYIRRTVFFFYTYYCIYIYTTMCVGCLHISKTVFIAFEFDFRHYKHTIYTYTYICVYTWRPPHSLFFSFSRVLRIILAVDEKRQRMSRRRTRREPLEPQRAKVYIKYSYYVKILLRQP